MNAILITDYFKNSGLGNYLRSYYLYKFIKKRNYLNADFQILSKKRRNNNKKYNIIILDLPYRDYNIKEILKKFAKKKYKVIGLDYSLKYKIDCNISIYKKSIYALKNFVGLKYSIIRKEFINKKFNFDENLFFISIGSSDIKNIKNKIKKLFFPYFKKLHLNNNIKGKKNFSQQKKYLDKMISCKMAASNGGTTLLELLFLKKIVFVYPQNKYELIFSRYLKKKGYVIFINIFNLSKKKFLNYNNKVQKIGNIDEFGAERILKIIVSYKNDIH